MTAVCVAEGLVMDASEAATETIGAIGAKKAGKSYLAGVLMEQLHDAGAPFAVFDPVGNWHSLTLAADGKGPGLSVVVIGGERADVPIDLERGEELGGYLIEHGISAVIDVSELSKAKRKTYVAAVAEAMFRAARRVKSPYCVVFEEAQLFAPQHAGAGEERMLGAVTDIVRLGRNHGLGSVMLTQRPQSVSKEVLNMIECLFVGNLRGPQERKTIKGWIDEQGAEDARAGLDELPRLPPGEFFCWSPSWLRVFRRVKINAKRTYDGSSTPKLGQRAKALPARGARGGLDQVIAALAALGPPAPAETVPRGHPDMARESAELAELRSRCAAAEEENASLWPRVRGLETVLGRLRSSLQPVFDSLCATLDMLPDAGEPVTVPGVCRVCGCTDEDCSECVERTGAPCTWIAPDLCSACVLPAKHEAPEKRRGRKSEQSTTLSVPHERDNPVPARARRAPASITPASGKLDGPMRRILTVLVVHGRMPKRRLALLAGYSAGGGGFNNPLGRLRTGGFAEGANEIGPTDAGRRAIGRVESPPPTGRALLDWWLNQPSLDGPMRKILSTLAKAGRPLMPDELAELAEYVPRTGGFNNPLGRLKTLGLVVGGRGEKLKLAADLVGRKAA